jgi:hypothetical protein
VSTLTVTLTLGGGAKGAVSPTTLTIPSVGAAQSATQLQYQSLANGNYTDTLTATSGAYASATASFKR